MDGHDGAAAPLQPSMSMERRASIGDDRISGPAAQRLMLQFVNNLTLLKVRMLGVMEVPLSADEEAVVLRDDADSLDRVGFAAHEELKLLQETLRKGPYESAEGRVLDGINSMYRFVYEELSLRWHACEEERSKKYASQRVLTAAVDQQRKLKDSSDAAKSKAEARVRQLEQQLADMTRRAASLEKDKKEDFDAYIKEVACLKEQLFRSYKDKSYVGKPVDMLRFVRDDDTCEDVSVDELLKARRMVRNAEKEAEALKERITSLTADVSSKTRMVKRVEERLHASEAITQSLQGDVEALNDALEQRDATIRQQKNDLGKIMAANKILRENEFARLANLVDSEAQTDPLKKEVSKYDVGAEQIPEMHRERSRLQLFHMYAEQVTANEALKAEHEKFAKEGLAKMKALEEEIEKLEDERDAVQAELEDARGTIEKQAEEIRVLTAKVEALTEQLAAAIKAKEAAEQERDEAVEAKRLAEERAEEAVTRCATHSQQVAGELASANKALELAQKRNGALCQAFLNISDRLEEIKTRAGLRDYKRRANEFHFKRAEAAIAEARAEMARREEECKEREAAAAQRVEHAFTMLRFTREDLRESRRVHAEEIRVLTERTAAVQDAFEALLQDFNRLREDYLKAAGGTATEYLKGWSAQAAQLLGKGQPGQPDDDDKADGPRHKFAFEKPQTGGDVPASVGAITQRIFDLASVKPGKLAKVSDVVDPEDGDLVQFNDAVKKQTNEAAASAVDHIIVAFATQYRRAHETFGEIWQLDKAIEAKENAIAIAAKAAGDGGAKAVAKGPGGKKSQLSRAAEHARHIATRDLEAERAGLQQQRVMCAWGKLKLLQQLDDATRAAVAAACDTLVTAGLTHAPVEPMPAAAKASEELVAKATAVEKPSETPSAAESRAASPPGSPKQSFHHASSEKRAAGKQGVLADATSAEASVRDAAGALRSEQSTSRRTPLPALAGAGTLGDAIRASDSATGLAEALPSNNDVLRKPADPDEIRQRRSHSLGDIRRAATPSVARVPRWGGAAPLPTSTTPAPTRTSGGPVAPDPMPRNLPRSFGAGAAAAGAPLLPDVLRRPAVPLASSTGSAGSRPHTSAAPVVDPDDAFLGDHANVDGELDRIRESLRSDAPRDATPAWQRQKERLRAAMRDSASPSFDPPPTRQARTRRR